MPRAILYHGFGIRGYQHLRTQFKEGCIYFHLVRSTNRCSFCHSFKVTQKGFKVRTLRTLPIGRKRVFVVIRMRRFYCEQCRRRRFEDLLIAERRKHYTRALERYVRDLCLMMTILDVAQHTGLHWATVKAIDRRRLKKNLPSASDLRRLRYLGIDEVSLKRRHRYLTTVVDLRTGRVVYVGEGRGERSLAPFFKKLHRLKVPLKAVTLDMWRPYVRAIRTRFPQTALVYDAFHILADYSRMLDALRTQEYNKLTGPMRKIIKGTRFLLLRGQEKLSIPAKEKLQKLLQINRNLFIAYVLKEELRRLWRFESREEAERFFFDWIKKALNSGIRKLVKFATRLLRHAEGILNYFRYPISTAMVEGINNKIKVVKRKAYGYRDVEYFKLKIYNLHLSRYSLLR
jgi:transposase